MEPIDEKDRAILALAQGDLPIDERPFDAWACELGMDVGELLERMRQLKGAGVIREVKAVLRHHSAGFSSGAMVAWAVPGDKVEEVGGKMAGHDRVTHCYERPSFGKYNVFTMIHGRSDTEIAGVIQEIVSLVGIREYRVFRSVRELKKSSMKYF